MLVVEGKRRNYVSLTAAPVNECLKQQKDMNHEQHHKLNNNMFSVQIMKMEFLCLCEKSEHLMIVQTN